MTPCNISQDKTCIMTSSKKLHDVSGYHSKRTTCHFAWVVDREFFIMGHPKRRGVGYYAGHENEEAWITRDVLGSTNADFTIPSIITSSPIDLVLTQHLACSLIPPPVPLSPHHLTLVLLDESQMSNSTSYSSFHFVYFRTSILIGHAPGILQWNPGKVNLDAVLLTCLVICRSEII